MDRQSVTVHFANGSLCTLMLTGGAASGSRHIHIVGDKGEIFGTLNDMKITIRKRVHDGAFHDAIIKEIDVSEQLKGNGHSGGDYAIMHDYVRYLNGDRSSISITDINDSVYGHLCVYAAEESRKTHQVQTIKTLD